MPRKIALAAEAYLPGKCLLARAHFTRAGGIANNQTAFSDRRIHGGGRVASARAVVSGGADCAPQRDREGVPPVNSTLQQGRGQHRPDRGASEITDRSGAVIA